MDAPCLCLWKCGTELCSSGQQRLEHVKSEGWYLHSYLQDVQFILGAEHTWKFHHTHYLTVLPFSCLARVGIPTDSWKSEPSHSLMITVANERTSLSSHVPSLHPCTLSSGLCIHHKAPWIYLKKHCECCILDKAFGFLALHIHIYVVCFCSKLLEFTRRSTGIVGICSCQISTVNCISAVDRRVQPDRFSLEHLDSWSLLSSSLGWIDTKDKHDWLLHFNDWGINMRDKQEKRNGRRGTRSHFFFYKTNITFHLCSGEFFSLVKNLWTPTRHVSLMLKFFPQFLCSCSSGWSAICFLCT